MTERTEAIYGYSLWLNHVYIHCLVEEQNDVDQLQGLSERISNIGGSSSQCARGLLTVLHLGALE